MAEPRSFDLDTLALHAGQRPDPEYGARAAPIYQTTSYVFPDADTAASMFNLERPGHLYSRISNPTVAVLEERLAALEGGVGAICAASGQSALHLAVATLMGAGSRIVASKSIYGGSYNMMRHTLPRFGIETDFVDPRDPEAFAAAIRPETRLLFGETLGNPGLEVLDIPAVADIAHRAGLPLMIDNTFATPRLCRPLALGADIVMHSATKFLGGHGVAIGGALVDGGRFDWRASGKFPTLTEPYAGYHGIAFAEEYGPAAMVMRARAEGLRDFGCCMSPQNAFYILLGVETLGPRMERHVAQCAPRRRVPRQPRGGVVGDMAGAAGPPGPCAGETPAARRLRRDFLLRHRRRARGRADFHRAAAPFLAPGECGRRQVAGHPSGDHHPPADERRRARGGGNRRGSGPPVVGLEDPGDLVDDLAQALRAARRTR